jgi:hypothetical protein
MLTAGGSLSPDIAGWQSAAQPSQGEVLLFAGPTKPPPNTVSTLAKEPVPTRTTQVEPSPGGIRAWRRHRGPSPAAPQVWREKVVRTNGAACALI